MTRVSPPTYLSWASEGRGRILPPWLHKNLMRFLGEPGAEPEDMVSDACIIMTPHSQFCFPYKGYYQTTDESSFSDFQTRQKYQLYI